MIQHITHRHRTGAVLISALMLLLSACGGYGSSYNPMTGAGLVSAITISPAAATIAVNGTQQYTAVAKDSNNNTVNGVSYTWTSSNPGVATVNSAGLATGVMAGTTVITASTTYTSGGGVYGGGTPITITSNKATLTVSAAGAVMGTAAVGRALNNALVSLKDTQGHLATAMTDRNGRYLIQTDGLTPPFLLKAVDNQGRTLFSFGTGAGVINIDPYTDVMARIWYQVRGTTPEAAFANPAAFPAPTAAAIAVLNRSLVGFLTDSLVSQGLNPVKFSLISTPFTADHTGFDRILDNSSMTFSENGVLLHEALSDSETEIRFAGSKGTIIFNTVNHLGTEPELKSTTLMLPAAR